MYNYTPTMQITNITTSRKLEDILHIYLLFMATVIYIKMIAG